MSDVQFNDDYFRERHLNDRKRLSSFALEELLIRKHNPSPNRVLDFGCSTGEFLEFLGFLNQSTGVEINQLARRAAASKGITVVDDIQLVSGTFDLIIFRGTIQHLHNPFDVLAEAVGHLEPGGYLIFLSTPDCESLYFRLFGSLPALDLPKVYMFPSEQMLTNFLARHSCDLIEKQRPYLKSGYASLLDIPRFLGRLTTRSSRFASAFPGNMMNLVYRKSS